jgi:hypothetical protein
LLITAGLSRRDDSNPFSALGIYNGKNHAFDCAGSKKAILAVVLAKVLFDQCEEIVEDTAGLKKADSVSSKIGLRFGLVPLKLVSEYSHTGDQQIGLRAISEQPPILYCNLKYGLRSVAYL